MYDKEQIYDDKINPLMEEIIKICEENNIQFLASFALKEINENVGSLSCTTYIQSSEYNSKKIEDAMKVIQGGYVAQNPYNNHT